MFRTIRSTLSMLTIASSIAAAAEPLNVGPPGVASDARNQIKLVVAFGDSIFGGSRLRAGAGFAAVLERELQTEGVAVHVVAAGVPGDTSTSGALRLAVTLDRLPRKPDLVLLGLGVNDMQRGLPASMVRDNLDAMLAELKRRQIAAMLVAMVDPEADENVKASFRSAFSQLAAKYAIPLYPAFLDDLAGHPELTMPDRLHPNVSGVKAVAGRLGPRLAAILKAQ